MSSTTFGGGSGVSTHSITPSLHIAPLINLLSQLLEKPTNIGEHPLLSYIEGKVVINTRGVLHRMYKSEKFNSYCEPTKTTGFVRDLYAPPKGTTARVGGKLLSGSHVETSKAVNQLVNQLQKHINQAIPENIQNEITSHSVEEAIKAIASNFSVTLPKEIDTAIVVPVAFANSERKIGAKESDLARMFSGIETLEGGDALERFIVSATKYMQRYDNSFDDDEIASITQSIRTRSVQSGDTVQRFLHFLEDEALSRVRLQVSMELMSALSKVSSKVGFKTYVSRVLDCFKHFAGPLGESLHIDVSSDFGARNNIDFAEALKRSGFYTCLPVWPEWCVQLFESRPDTLSTTGNTVREVSYRFRVNGVNPEENKPAFNVRLNNHENNLKNEDPNNLRISRQIAELLFLWLVVPNDMDKPEEFDLQRKAAKLAHLISLNPKQSLITIISDLRKRQEVMEKLANELVSLVSDKAHRLPIVSNTSPTRFRVSVSRDIIDTEALTSYSDKSELLKRNHDGNDNIEWLKYLTVGEDVLTPNSLISFVVNIQLYERSLVAIGQQKSIYFKHQLDSPVLPIRLTPYKLNKENQQWEPIPDTENALNPGYGIDVQYEEVIFQKKHIKGKDIAPHEQRRAASICAFSLLVYTTLWLTSRQLRKGNNNLTTLLLRVAREGKLSNRDADATNPSTTLYAISHALEKALAREGNVKLQGYTSGGNENTRAYRKRGSVAALLGGQSLKFKMEGNLERVALISYVTRPCDSQPLSSKDEVFLFTCRTYVAERDGEFSKLNVARMRNRVIGDKEAIGDAQSVMTELAWLAEQGYEHVVLLSHHFGNRHLGRAAERHAPHGTLDFLEDAHYRFPQMRFYTLRKDVFPATRLRKRNSNESAFEVVTFADHQQLYENHVRDLFRGVMPIYTFATLNIIGGEISRPQSGFCTYFFDVDQRMHDLAWQESIKADILGYTGTGGVRMSLISVLRAIHFMESERSGPSVFLPVLDPFNWTEPLQRAAAGEVEIMGRRRDGNVFLSLPAVLSHVTEVLKISFSDKSND